MTKWASVSVEQARAHQLYGIKGWLMLLVIAVVLSFGRQAYDNLELTVIPKVSRYALFVVWIIQAFLAVAFLTLATFSRRSRWLCTLLFVAMWPVTAGFAAAAPKDLGWLKDAVWSIAPQWLLWTVVWTWYLQSSRRVRVTFEHSVRANDLEAEQKTNSTPP